MISDHQKLYVIDSSSNGKFKVEVLGYKTLSGNSDPSTSQAVYYANKTGLQLKQVKITLQGSEAITEAGALHFLHGQIEVENKTGGMGGLGKAMINKFITNEAAFMPRYRGTGEIYLEPSFSHFLIYQLNNEEIIADKGMFSCCEGSIDVGVAMQKKCISGSFWGRGIFSNQGQGKRNLYI